MERVIVYLDDADHAKPRLPPAGALPTHWILVACAPRMTRRISKWVSHSSRENWRGKWAERLFEQLAPGLRAAGHEVTTVLARSPLPELTRELRAQHGAATILDLRRPRTEPGAFGNSGQLLGLGAMFAFIVD